MPFARTIRFPVHRSMGDVLLRDADAPLDAAWTDYKDARDRVAIPDGKDVMLKVSWSAAIDLSPLADLEYDDIQYLDCRDTEVDDRRFASAAGLTGLKGIGLGNTAVGDDSLAPLENFHSLRELYLARTKVAGHGLAAISESASLVALALNNTKIGDVHMRHVGRIGGLERLWMKNTLVGDVGLLQLKHLGRLHSLDLRGTDATEAGVEQLRRFAPRCRVLL